MKIKLIVIVIIIVQNVTNSNRFKKKDLVINACLKDSMKNVMLQFLIWSLYAYKHNVILCVNF